jgi:hypothetical protein
MRCSGRGCVNESEGSAGADGGAGLLTWKPKSTG